MVTLPKFARARNVSYHQVKLPIGRHKIHLKVFLLNTACLPCQANNINHFKQWSIVKETHSHWKWTLEQQFPLLVTKLGTLYLTYTSSHFNPPSHTPNLHRRDHSHFGVFVHYGIIPWPECHPTFSSIYYKKMTLILLIGIGWHRFGWYIFTQGWTVGWKFFNPAGWCGSRRTQDCERC